MGVEPLGGLVLKSQLFEVPGRASVVVVAVSVTRGTIRGLARWCRRYVSEKVLSVPDARKGYCVNNMYQKSIRQRMDVCLIMRGCRCVW
jgi:hypothetical protein